VCSHIQKRLRRQLIGFYEKWCVKSLLWDAICNSCELIFGVVRGVGFRGVLSLTLNHFGIHERNLDTTVDFLNHNIASQKQLRPQFSV
jgi:hypothetical protein